MRKKKENILKTFLIRSFASYYFLQENMYVIKRDGRKEIVHFDKITSRITKLCYG